ncbi:MAG: anion transporter [Thermostichales cyanobacterium HHBFW_bins_127]
MTFPQLLGIPILVVTYVGLAIGGIPGWRMNRATLALAGAGLLVGLGVIPVVDAWRAMDPTTMLFLLSLMIVNASLSAGGVFSWLLRGIVRLTHSPWGLLVGLTWGCGILSAFLLNDTMVLVFTPLVIRLTQAVKLPAVPYLLVLAGATNLGSLATLTGNPQNILVGSLAGLDYLSFARTLTPLAVVGLGLQTLWLAWLYPVVRSRAPFPQLPVWPVRTYPPLFRKSLLITLGLLSAFALGMPVAPAALTAASLLLMTRRIKPQRFLGAVDWSVLVMFAGLFVLTAVTRSLLPIPSFPLLPSVVVLSNLISNVPAVLLLHPQAQTPADWYLLAAGSTLAGNLTLLGSVANLIVVEAAARQGERLSFWEHLRFGLPLTLVLCLLGFWWISHLYL